MGAPRPSRRPLPLAAGALAATVMCRLPSLHRPVLDVDEATFASVAALMNAGGRLYLDGGVDNKFPGIYWTYAAVFRVFGRYAMGGVHAVELAAVIATALLLGACARGVVRGGSDGGAGRSPERAAWLAVLFYGVYTSVYYPKMIAANTEIFMMLPLAGSFALTLAARRTTVGEGARLALLAVAGALVGAGCLWKQVAIVCLPLPAFSSLWQPGRAWRARLGGAAAAGVGCALVIATLVAWLRAEGTLDGWLHWTLTTLVTRYGPSGWRAREYLGALLLGVVPFAAAAAVPVLGTTWLVARARAADGAERLCLAWLALCAVGVAAGGRYFGHYFIQVAGPLALCGAVEIERRLALATAARARRLGVAVGLFTALPAVGFAVVAMVLDPITERPGGPPAGYREVTAYIRAHTAPDERVFVWGMATPLYLDGDRVPATRFVGFLRGLARGDGESPDHAWDAGPEVWPLLLEDFAAHPPALVVDTAPADYFHFAGYPMTRFPALARWVTDHCDKEATIGGVDFYRRRR